MNLHKAFLKWKQWIFQKGNRAYKLILLIFLLMFLVVSNNSPAFAVDTPTAGGSWGRPFTIQCALDEVAIGIRGYADGYVNRLGAICMKAEDVVVRDPFGIQLRPPRLIDTSSVGEIHGREFRRQCPFGSVISAISGRSGWYVDQLIIHCSAFNRNTLRVESERSSLSSVGGRDGSPFGPFVCPSNLPGVGFRGRAGRYIDSIALICRNPSLTPASLAHVYLNSNGFPVEFLTNFVQINWIDRSEDESRFLVTVSELPRNSPNRATFNFNADAVNGRGSRTGLNIVMPLAGRARSFTYRVCAIINSGQLCTNGRGFTTPAVLGATDPPSNITWRRIGTTEIRVSWNHPGGADSFRVYITPPDRGDILAATVSGTQSQADISPLLPSVAYRVRVCAVTEIGEFCGNPIIVQIPLGF